MLKGCKEKIFDCILGEIWVYDWNGVVLSHIISIDGIEVHKLKTDLIINLPPHLCERGELFPYIC